jgi:hypothetical protein
MCLDLAIVISDNPAIVLFGLAVVVRNHFAVVSFRFTIGLIYGTLKFLLGLPLSRPHLLAQRARVETLRH